MKTQIQLILSTIALTVLIWVYADRQGYQTIAATVTVRLTPAPGMIPRIAGARSDALSLINVPIQVRGRKAAIGRVAFRMGSGEPPFELTVPIPDDIETGQPRIMDIAEPLGELAAIKDEGLEVVELGQEAITVIVDRYAYRDIEIRVNAGVYTDSLQGAPLVEPRIVQARVRESALADIRNPDFRQEVLIAEQIEKQLEKQTWAGADHAEMTLKVPVGSKWQGIDAVFEPSTVTVHLQLERRTEPESIPLIPLKITQNLQQDLLGQYEVVLKEDARLTQAIEVRTPSEKAGQLKGHMILALLEIKEADLPTESKTANPTTPDAGESWKTRAVRFVMPDGFEDVEVVRDEGPVEFRLKKRLAP